MLPPNRNHLLSLLVIFSMICAAACSNRHLDKRGKNIEIAENWMSAVFSEANILSAKALMHEDFRFTYMGETHLSNISYDEDGFFGKHLVIVDKLLPDVIGIRTTDVIADDSSVALVMEGNANGINGEYNNRYVFTFKIENDLILSVTEYNSDLLVMTRLYKNQLVPIQE